tara:strand:- start:783 stop:1226 length:444 start_codon:yes stop_codon:yes gene_type:complete
MTKSPIDYSKAIIYKISCNDNSITNCYVGSTTNFRIRKHRHKYNCCIETANEYNMKIYQFIRSNGGWENWTMVLIETYPTTTALELFKRERYWYDELKANLNTKLPHRTPDEDRILRKNYKQVNKEKANLLQRLRRQKNKLETQNNL